MLYSALSEMISVGAASKLKLASSKRTRLNVQCFSEKTANLLLSMRSMHTIPNGKLD